MRLATIMYRRPLEYHLQASESSVAVQPYADSISCKGILGFFVAARWAYTREGGKVGWAGWHTLPYPAPGSVFAVAAKTSLLAMSYFTHTLL